MNSSEAVQIWRRALALHESGRLGEAEALYRRLLASPYEAAKIHRHLALVEFASGRRAEARASLEHARDLEPGDADVHHDLGRVYEAAGLKQQAAACYRQAIALRLGHAGAQDNLTRLQAKYGWTDADNPVSIITATIGRPQLARAIKSVSAQRYRNIQHLIVADGPEAETEVRRIVAAAAPSIPTHVMVTPWQTGIDSFQGHRIFAACLHIVDGRFVAFLDDDNWFDEDHISSLVNSAIAGGLEWTHSLRRIVDGQGNFLMNDDCQSLGAWESIEAAQGTDRHHHVDANCYLIRRDIAVAHSAVWQRRSQDDLKSPDYLLCRTLMAERRRFACTGKYSLNYALGGRSISVQAEFFEAGNAAMRARYPQGFPWAAQPAGTG